MCAVFTADSTAASLTDTSVASENRFFRKSSDWRTVNCEALLNASAILSLCDSEVNNPVTAVEMIKGSARQNSVMPLLCSLLAWRLNSHDSVRFRGESSSSSWSHSCSSSSTPGSHRVVLNCPGVDLLIASWFAGRMFTYSAHSIISASSHHKLSIHALGTNILCIIALLICALADFGSNVGDVALNFASPLIVIHAAIF